MPKEKIKSEITTTTQEPNDSSIDSDSGAQFNIREQTDNNTREIERLRNDLTRERQNNITVFGIFASLVTFFSIEIQIFKNIENFWLLIGLSAFLVSSMLIFVLSLGAVMRNDLKWGNYFKNPIFWVFVSFLIFSFLIFFLNSKGINIDIKGKN